MPSTTDRDASFQIAPGTAVYGGFAGNETELDERDPEKNITILSGDIDRNDANAGGSEIDRDVSDIVGDNSFAVVRLDGTLGEVVGNDTIVDGFTITGGLATGYGYSTMAGAGLSCNGEGMGSECSPTLRNIVFSGNQAQLYGGALLDDAFNAGTSKPILENVTFVGNAADQGGAIYNDGSYWGESSPSIRQAKFYGNSAGQGGAIYSNGNYVGGSNSSVVNSIFGDNTASECGGAITLNSANGGSAAILT